MVETSINMFDLGVLVVVGLSALLSFFRGFVREVLSLGSWLAATIITLYMFQPASKFIAPHVGGETIASGLASMGVFFISLIVLTIFTGLLLKFVKPGNEVGVLDNLMGLAFGVARGVLVVAIGYFVATIFYKEESDLPDVVHDAKSRPYISKAAKWVGKLTPDYLDTIAGKSKESKDDADEDLGEASKKSVNELLRKLDKKAGKAIDNSGIDEDMPERSLPSIEDLQEQIRKENERR